MTWNSLNWWLFWYQLYTFLSRRNCDIGEFVSVFLPKHGILTLGHSHFSHFNSSFENLAHYNFYCASPKQFSLWPWWASFIQYATEESVLKELCSLLSDLTSCELCPDVIQTIRKNRSTPLKRLEDQREEAKIRSKLLRHTTTDLVTTLDLWTPPT